MNSLNAFVYLAEYETVKDILPDWPTEMRLALGLHVNGKCELAVFHRNEANSIIKRMSLILNLPIGSFGIVPERQGYPTKAIRFSDQALLLELIATKDGLCETASDYEINYRFAEEEGLDPIHFTSSAHRGKKPVKLTPPKDDAMVLSFASRRIQIKADKKPAPKKIHYNGRFAELALMKKNGKNIHITINPDSLTSDAPILKAEKVGQRDEQSQIILERSLLGKWKHGNSAIIEIPLEKLSCRLSIGYLEQPYVEAAIIVPNGIYVTYNFKIKCDENTANPIEPVNYPFHKNAMRGMTFADTQKTYK